MALAKLGSVASASSVGFVASLTYSLTVGAGSNRCIALGVVSYGAIANSRTITWNSQSLTRVGIVEFVVNEDAAELWQLPEASLSTTTANVVVTAVTTNQHLASGSQVWSGVDQTTPFGTWVTATGTSTAPSVTATTVSGDEVIDALGAYYNGTGLTLTPTYTAGWEYEHGTSTQDSAGQSSRSATTTSTQIGWTLSQSSTSWWYGAAALKPVAAVITPTIAWLRA